VQGRRIDEPRRRAALERLADEALVLAARVEQVGPGMSLPGYGHRLPR
jgi:hypothetical protein